MVKVSGVELLGLLGVAPGCLASDAQVPTPTALVLEQVKEEEGGPNPNLLRVPNPHHSVTQVPSALVSPSSQSLQHNPLSTVVF